MDRAVEEDDEEEESGPENDARSRDAGIRDVVGLDVSHERVGERERADERPEDRLEQPVAVEDPQVPRREVPVAIWTRRTATVTTNPTRVTLAETTAARTDAAVEAEYVHGDVTSTKSRALAVATAKSQPRNPATSGTTHRLSRR